MSEFSVALARELRSISESLGRIAVALDGGRGPAEGGKRHVSPERYRALELHGRYLSFLSRLGKPERARVKVRRQRQGVEAAIALARRLTSRK